jgi:hypothetical protein
MMITSKLVAALGLSAAVLGTAAAAHATYPSSVTIPFPTVAWGSWGPIYEAQVDQIGCLFTNNCGDFVRGQLSKRHSRDRLFYNTTSNAGTYVRTLSISCSSSGTQTATGTFYTNADGDLTLFCNGGESLLNGYAVITSY